VAQGVPSGSELAQHYDEEEEQLIAPEVADLRDYWIGRLRRGLQRFWLPRILRSVGHLAKTIEFWFVRLWKRNI